MLNQKLLTLLLLLTGWAWPAVAELKYAQEGGFHLELALDVPTDPDTAYQQFLRVGEWWDSDHTWFGDAANLSIDPRAGGCFCERAGDREVMHLQVSHVDPGRALHLLGGLGPLQGLGLYGAMSWKFEALEEGATRIVHSYRVTGFYPGGLQELAKAVDRVQSGQARRLQAILADGAARP